MPADGIQLHPCTLIDVILVAQYVLNVKLQFLEVFPQLSNIG